jgi:hypothetical protein
VCHRVPPPPQVTELCWYDELWPVMADLYKDFTMNSMGVRCSGAAAANLCHLAEGGAGRRVGVQEGQGRGWKNGAPGLQAGMKAVWGDGGVQ